MVSLIIYLFVPLHGHTKRYPCPVTNGRIFYIQEKLSLTILMKMGDIEDKIIVENFIGGKFLPSEINNVIPR